MPVKRAAALTGINEKTINRWIKKSERKVANVEATSRKRSFQRLDNFDEDVIIRAVYDMFEKKYQFQQESYNKFLKKTMT